jgi:hypothetical protein
MVDKKYTLAKMYGRMKGYEPGAFHSSFEYFRFDKF